MLNARRLNRLAKDWPVAVLAVGITVALLWWELRMGGDPWLVELLGNGGPRIFMRVVGLLCFSGIYLLHYKSYRSMDLMGIQAPSGWAPGIAAVAVGLVAMMTLTRVMLP
jgi:hypothetical protein